jgi:hypothetical protein
VAYDFTRLCITVVDFDLGVIVRVIFYNKDCYVIVAWFLNRFAPPLSAVGLLVIVLFQYLMLSYWYPTFNTAIFQAVAISYTIPFGLFNVIQFAWIMPTGLLSWKVMVVSHGEMLVFPHKEFTVIWELFHVSSRDIEPAFFLSHFSSLLNLIPNLSRLSLALIFVGSFLLKPLRYPIMTLWARVIESDRPVFALLFGGSAAIVKVVHEVVVLL